MMKTALAIFCFLFVSGISAQVPEYEYDYIFFDNSLMPGNYFYSSVSYSEDSYIENLNGKLPVSRKMFFTPPNSLELDFVNGEEPWKAVISFARLRGNDFFKPAKNLSFWIYPETMDGASLYPDILISNNPWRRRSQEKPEAKYSDTLHIVDYVGSIEKNGWKQVKIPLKDFAFDPQPNNVIFLSNAREGKGKLWVDQVELLPETSLSVIPRPGTISAIGYELHVDITWPEVSHPDINYVKIYRSENNKDFIPVGIRKPWYNRYTDYTGKAGQEFYYKISYLDYNYNETTLSETAEASTQSFTDEELLDMVQEASFRYYWEGAEPHSGLARENIPGRFNMIATGASGFGIMAIIVGVERGFISREWAIDRMKKITKFLKNCDHYHGAVSHFIDGPTGKTEPFFGNRDNGGDLVETSFLFQGLLVARSYFNENTREEKAIRKAITELWEGVEWDWYDREKEGKFLTWHWSPDQEWVIDHKLIGWNETMITYILAIASPTHAIDSSMYYNGWASQEERAVNYRKNWGKTEDGSLYTNGNSYQGIKLDVGVANGGPLFFIHYSYMGLDPHKVNDRYTNYFENNRNIALINWKYCAENPNHHKGIGESFWGFTASDGPRGYRALEPVKDKEDGTMAPTGALASFPYTPEQSMEALKNMYRNHGNYLWGEYGFRDAVNLDENWCAPIYMGLNQAPVAVMIENYRSGLIWELFMENEEIGEALEKIREGK